NSTYRFLVLLPAVIICRHGDTCIANPSLLSENHLWNCGHVDNICPPGAEHEAFCPGAKARSLDCDHCPF
ncbi:unnamed protein product, partial [Gulo gulo]